MTQADWDRFYAAPCGSQEATDAYAVAMRDSAANALLRRLSPEERAEAEKIAAVYAAVFGRRE